MLYYTIIYPGYVTFNIYSDIYIFSYSSSAIFIYDITIIKHNLFLLFTGMCSALPREISLSNVREWSS